MESINKAPKQEKPHAKCQTCVPDKKEIKAALGCFAGEKLSVKKCFANLDLFTEK